MSDIEGVASATEGSIAAASHLTDLDAGAVAALRHLARKIDDDDRLRESYLDYADERGLDLRPLAVDNVSIPTYLKFCESLGLTPAGRLKLGDKKEPAGGKLAQLRAVQGGQSQRGPRKSG